MRYVCLTLLWVSGAANALLPAELSATEIESYKWFLQNPDTLKVVTWNIEWFGADFRGPEDTELQMRNVIEVLDSLKADIYALQEIFNQEIIDGVTTRLQGSYSGFIACYINQAQRLAFIYNTEKIDSVSAGPVPDFTEYYWAGRIPLTFTASIRYSQLKKKFTFINQHGKAFPDAESYNRRMNASQELYEFISADMDSYYLFLGDYNDDVKGSIRSGEESPYKNLADDDGFQVLTLPLSESGEYSYSNTSGTIRSMIDHITVNEPVFRHYIEGSEYVHRAEYIPEFLATTSDHYPVVVKFDLNQKEQNESEAGDQTGIRLLQNYPNPFNPSTAIPFFLDRETRINLALYDIQGRKVMLIADEVYPAGFHELSIDASNLAGGIYLYRLETGETSLVRKMTLIK